MTGEQAIALPNRMHTDGHDKPRYGARLLPLVLDELAQTDPERVFTSIPLSADLSQGFCEVTVQDVAHAVSYVAWWLEERIGRSYAFETVAYMGISDIRYTVIFLAAVKCGYKVLLPSVRNSTSMTVSLLDQTDCTTFLYPLEMKLKVRELQTEKPNLPCYAVPSFEVMLKRYSQTYPYNQTFESARWDPILILCSSGSTGPPKPIVTCHGTYSVYDGDRNLPCVKGRKNQNASLFNFDDGGRYFSAFPPFHLAGFMSMVLVPIFSTTATLVLGPPNIPPNGMLVSEIMRHYKLRALFVPPAIAEQLVQEPGGLEQAKTLDFLLYAGGPLNPIAGEPLSEVTDLCQFYGSTETGPVQALVPLRENWAYLEWHPLYEADMQLSVDGAYEMILHGDPKFECMRSLAHSYPDADVWRTKDLFKPHPTKPNLWKFYGRTDDIIVLSNGEKFNPVPMEMIIQGHPILKGALIVGDGLFQPVLLVESKDSTTDEHMLIENIWTTVEKANSEGPGHARITQSSIIVAKYHKPFQRAAKGTIVRKSTAEEYLSEVKKLFSDQNNGVEPDFFKLDMTNDLLAIKKVLRSLISPLLTKLDISDHDDFYVLGLDSLKTIELAGKIKQSLLALPLGPDLSWCTNRVVYLYPSINKLSQIILDKLNTISVVTEISNGDLTETRVTEMVTLVERYTQGLPYTPSERPGSLWSSDIYAVLDAARKALCAALRISRPSVKIIMTGSTGSLGSNLLKAFLRDPAIGKIYCLNRSEDAQERNEATFQAMGFHCNMSKVHYLRADYGDPHLGLSQTSYHELFDANIIIHNAWKIDFNHTLASYESKHIRGTRNLIDLSRASSQNPHIIFISSISSVANWSRIYPTSKDPIPEAFLDNYHLAQHSGYAESKHVAERILQIAHDRSGVPVTILRVGQIAGPVLEKSGVWNRHEWLPALVQTSCSMGLIPDWLPDVDWIPVDILASCVTDIVHHSCGTANTGTAQCYNLVNPHSAKWADMLSLLHRRLGPHCKIVSLEEWLSALGKCDRNDEKEIASKPALKILNFYEGVLEGKSVGGGVYETGNGKKVSKTMRGMRGVSVEWMEMWLEQWGF